MAGSNSTVPPEELWRVAEAWRAISTSQSVDSQSAGGTIAWIVVLGILGVALWRLGWKR